MFEGQQEGLKGCYGVIKESGNEVGEVIRVLKARMRYFYFILI